jgi:hypothetical protein
MIRHCRCGANVFRRLNRSGWLEKEFLPKLLGLYPWECVQCRAKRFFRTSTDIRPKMTSDWD